VDRDDLFGKTQDEILLIVKHLKLPVYTANQISGWLYEKGVSSFEQMTNLSKEVRRQLESLYYIGRTQHSGVQESRDGTRKYLFPVKTGKFIEAVYIPEPKRATLCLSSQVGCNMGCIFCMTGKQGFQGNLSTGEILNQIYSLPEKANLKNYVFMGMGEPLANTQNVLKSIEILASGYGPGISPSRITVSTIGMLPGMEQLIGQGRCHLAISLHTPFEEERKTLMPVEKLYPIHRVVDFLKRNIPERQRRVSFEYILFKGVNDTARHINGLTRLLNGLRCRINLIRYHPIPGVDLEPTPEETVQWFKNKLNEKGLLTTIRASRGQDIFAACGMLSTFHQLVTGKE
jgi:23S rRNA (adenine2503-C2)-methyltransferase